MIIEKNNETDRIKKLANNKKLRDFLKGKTLAEQIVCCEILEYMYAGHILELQTKDFMASNHPLANEMKSLHGQFPVLFNLSELGLTDNHVELIHAEIALKRKIAPSIRLTPIGAISLLEELKIKSVESVAVISDDIVYSEEVSKYSGSVVHYFNDTSDELYLCRKILFQGITARNRDVCGKLFLGENFLGEKNKKYSIIIISQNGQKDFDIIDKAEELLAEDGIIIYCVSPKFLMADEYSDFRKKHIQKQNILTIYELENANRSPVFGALVLSKSASEKIRFISVANCIPSYRKPQNEGAVAVEVDYSDIQKAQKDSLSPAFFISNASRNCSSENYRQFSDAVELSRGSYTPVAKVQPRFTSERTGIRYLSISGIENGKLKDDIPYLTEILSQEEKYVAEKGDFVMSKIVNPLRFAEITSDDKILVSANLYILRPKKECIMPEYFKAYYGSKEMEQQLRSIARGEKNLSVVEVRELKELKILCPDLAEQKKFINRLQKLETEEKNLEEKLNGIRIKKEFLIKDLIRK